MTFSLVLTRFLFTQEPKLIVLCPIVVGKTENRQHEHFFYFDLLFFL